MNETSATSASGLSLLPDGIATLTAIHFTIIAVVAILVVIGLLWGIKAKRSRVKASRDVIANAEEAGVPPAPVDSDDQRATTPAPAPVEQRKAEQSQTQTRTVAPAPAPPPPPIERVSPVPATPTPARADPSPAIAPTVQPPAEIKAPPTPVDTPVSSPAFADGPVTQLKGLGPKVATQLGALGVTTVGEMAALSESEAQSIDAQLGNFTGRMGRDRWIEQARLLAAGDKAGFEAIFGKL
ncbi:putative flap endonuclease-1-like 5' DNA nuclease [Sphingomonas sp. BK036]|uniref:hypothetical protein n=1 Tax=Sphingomonas sp. BK036 TaxID=2512122 RepID=UPI001029F39A|nr:hypothetical protein [Sphingomonas sp. BK036]RZT57211.1 putative flap endonuclease-1-like 5' DNA nuclease [Sphingomonas sp. BK036]